MEVGSPEWIEASLAKLEQLEQQRAKHEHAIETVKEPMTLRRHTDELGRLDAEIKALYAQLEEFAEDDEDEDEGDTEAESAPLASPRTVGDDTLSAPHVAAPAMPASPLSAPISHAPAFVPASAPTPAAVPVAVAAPSYDHDDEPKGGAGKWIAIAVVVLAGLGVGGFFMMQKQKTDDQPAQNAGGSGEVIKAAEIPDDTEAPKAAKGADVDRTPTENAGAGTNSGSGSSGSKKDTKKDTKKVIKLGEGEDPLG